MTTTLIVDDDPDMRVLIRLAIELHNDGLTVVGEAADGEEALETWQDLVPPIPDVVVLDNRMPKLSGLEVAERILEQRPDQVVVLYSAFMDKELRSQADSLGIAACLTKSQIDQLPATIKELAAR